MKLARLATAMTLALGFIGTTLAPANAQSDIERVLRGVFGGGGRSNLAGNQGQIQANISSGFANITSQINSGVSSGRINYAEQAQLNAQLASIQNMHNSFMFDGGYSNDEVQQILSQFSSLNSQIAAAMNNNTGGAFPPIGTVPGYPGAIGSYDQAVALQNSVLSRINSGVASGALTAFEAQQLRNEYNRIASQINRRQLRGNLNANPVVRRLISLDQRVTQMVQNSRYAGGGYWY